jgi:hypothetical protein
MTKYTLVQHSGFTTGGNPQFRKAVEVFFASEQVAKAAEKAGGLVFDDYDKATEAEYQVNYPNKEYGGLIPCVRGNFMHVLSVSHLSPLYMPVPEEVEQFRQVTAS